MKAILTLLSILFFVSSSSSEVFTGEKLNQPFTVHGRLFCCACGGIPYRIWIVGSKRVLYVAGEATPAFERSEKVLGRVDSPSARAIFADFTVEPLAPDEKKHMRAVRILSIKRVVIATPEGKVIAKRAEL